MQFCEVVMFRTAVDKSQRHKADEYWHKGISIGVETSTPELLITIGSMLYKCACQNVRRMTEEERFNANYLDDVKVTVPGYVAKGASTQSLWA